MEQAFLSPRRTVERLTSADPNYKFPDLDWDVMDIVEGRTKPNELQRRITWNHTETDALGFPKGRGIDTTRAIVEGTINPCNYEYSV